MNDPRSPQQIREHYELERELARRLRTASRAERLGLYGPLYDELFTRLPHHPQNVLRADRERRAQDVKHHLTLLAPWLGRTVDMAEVGAGDCALSVAAAARCRSVRVIDVSAVISRLTSPPKNLSYVHTDGVQIDLPSESVNLVFSNQLIEHLHPEDAFEQTKEIFRILRPGGRYLCITPSRLTGPHDVSSHFDEVATGFHLQEYSLDTLSDLFRQVGFVDLRQSGLVKGRRVEYPLAISLRLERGLARVPARLRKSAMSRLPLRLMLNSLQLVGQKPAR